MKKNAKCDRKYAFNPFWKISAKQLQYLNIVTKERNMESRGVMGCRTAGFLVIPAKRNYLPPYQQTRNVRATIDFWPPNVNEGSPNCDPIDAATSHGALRSWGNARSSHLPLFKLNKKTVFGPR